MLKDTNHSFLFSMTKIFLAVYKTRTTYFLKKTDLCLSFEGKVPPSCKTYQSIANFLKFNIVKSLGHKIFFWPKNFQKTLYGPFDLSADLCLSQEGAWHFPCTYYALLENRLSFHLKKKLSLQDAPFNVKVVFCNFSKKNFAKFFWVGFFWLIFIQM